MAPHPYGRMAFVGTRWRESGLPRGGDYDARWDALADRGQNIHGEADLVEILLRESGASRVLDAGCGTGRVAIELARRGFSVVGVDSDAKMLAVAHTKNPALPWIEADLTDLTARLDAEFDLALLAGNVMIFLDPGTEATVLRELGTHLAPGGLLVSGFQIWPGRVSFEEYDRLAAAAGFEPVARWATWDREPFAGGNYAVSVHRLTSSTRLVGGAAQDIPGT
jgi:SAM-dependent methyltransferase